MAIDINALMSAPSRTIRSKVEITYLKPFDPEVPSSLSFPDISPYTDINQIANGNIEPDKRWFDSESVPIGDGVSFISTDPAEFEIGGWSTTKTDSNGDFTVPQVVEETYTLRTVISLQVVGDGAIPTFPVDFDVKVFNGVTELLNVTVIGNTEANWIHNISGTPLTADKIQLIVYKMNRANARLRIIEMGISAKDLLTDEIINSITYLEELYYTDGNLPIGAVSSDELTIRWYDPDRRWDVLNPDSPVSQSLKKHRRVKVWFGVDETPGNTVWYFLGNFFSVTWNIDRDNNIAEVTVRDTLELMRTTEYKKDIQAGVTLYDAFEDILLDFGLTGAEYEIDTSFQSIVFPYIWYAKGGHRAALTKLAQNSLANITADRDDKIIVSDTQPTASVQYAYDDSTNLFGRAYPLAWIDQVNQVQVPYSYYEYNAIAPVLKDTTPVDIPGSTTIEIELAYNSFPVRSDIALVLTAGANISYNILETYSWGVLVEFTNASGSQESITQIDITGYVLVRQSTSYSTSKDQDEIDESGLINQAIDTMDLVQEKAYADTLSSEILSRFGLQTQDAELETRGHIDLPLGSKVTLDGIDYMLTSQEFLYTGGLESTTIIKKI